MASQSLWDTLSEDDKKIFKEAALESVAAQREAWDELTEKSKKAVVENGNTVFEVTDFAPWRAAVEPVYEKYGAQYKDWLEKLQK